MSHPDDELVSSVLDGEATTAERARVEADPLLRTRLTEFHDVRKAMATASVPDNLAAAVRERALAAFAVEQDSTDREDAPRAPVISMTAAHRGDTRRRPHTGRALGVLGVAAAVLVALIGFGALLRGGSDDGDSATGSFTAAEPDTALRDSDGASTPKSAADSAGGAAGPAATAGAPNAREAAVLVDLGPVRDLDALRDAWRSATARLPSAATGPPQPGSATADPATASDTASACTAVLARATLAGRPVVLAASAGAISVFDATTCAPAGTFTP